jgi:hypothetical protein
VSSESVRHNRHPSQPRLKYWHALTRWVLHVPALRWMADRQVCELRFAGARSGRPIVLPVMYAQQGSTIVVLGSCPLIVDTLIIGS